MKNPMDAQSGDGVIDGQTPIDEVPPRALRGSTMPLEERYNSRPQKPARPLLCLVSARGKTRCRLHGGRSPSGIAHYNFKNGQCCKDLQGLGLADAYQRARQNPDLISHVEEVILAVARIGELLGQLREVETTFQEGICLTFVARRALSKIW